MRSSCSASSSGGAQLGAAAGGHGHHPAQARVGRGGAGELGGGDVGQREEHVGAVDHLLVAALLLGGALVGGIALPVGGEAAGPVELVVADHLDARLGLLDAGAEVLGQIHRDHDAGAGGLLRTGRAVGAGAGRLRGGGRHRSSFARTVTVCGDCGVSVQEIQRSEQRPFQWTVVVWRHANR
jgi:hypothetical protein